MNILRSLLRLTLGKRLPITSGELRIPGLESSVIIRRDKYGIPMIETNSQVDAMFALGFCHGQDRAAQLEVLLRLGRGTLAEMVGPKVLGADRVSRRIGFRHSAQQQVALLTDANRRQLEAYTNGINAAYTHGLSKRPHEFVLLRISPTPWEPADVLAYGKIQPWFMASNWDVELARLRILRADGPEALKALDPLGAADSVLSTEYSVLSTLDRLEADLKSLLEVFPTGGGSNNWVIAPSRTTTGRPILCNDPHLAPQVPAPWYLVSIRTSDWAVAGASFVGSPAVPCGHNGFASWGVTAGLTDNTDLFLEDLREEGGTWQYRQGERWLPCGVRREVIQVKGDQPVTEEVLSTSRGPIINPVLHDTPEAISLRAVWLDPLPLDGWLSAMSAKSFDQFRSPFREWPGFPMNLVYSDVTGKTAWQLAGQIPVRKRGHGLLPLPGWDDRNGWETELVPFEQMPFVEDPPEGFFATANNTPIQKEGGPFLGVDFLDGYRHQVIVEELRSRERWDLAGAASIQQCVRSIPWRECMNVLQSLHPRNRTSRNQLQKISEWDGLVSAQSELASIFEVFLSFMAIQVAKSKAPKSWEWAVGRGSTILNPFSFFGYRRTAHLIDLILRQPRDWFEDGWSETLLTELVAAVVAVDEIEYPSWSRAWGAIRPLKLQHILMTRTPLRSVFDFKPIPVGGDEHTPNHASPMPLDPLGPVKSFANLRATIDVGNWSASRFSLAGGQSGNPFSPHYDNLFKLWQKGEGVPIAFTADEMRAASVQDLRLQPK